MRLFLILFFLLSTPCFAGNYFTNEYTVTVEYQCMGADGIPISYGSDLSDCCDGDHLKDNPPSKCKAGISSGADQTAYGSGAGIQLAHAALNTSGALDNPGSGAASPTPAAMADTGGGGSTAGSSSALWNGSSPTSDAEGGASAGSGKTSAGLAGGASAGGAGGSGGSGSGGVGSVGGTSAVKGDDTDYNNQKANGGGYVGGGGAGAGKGGDGNGLFGGLFGSLGGGGASGGGNGAGGPDELKFGEGGEGDPNANGGQGANGDEDGSRGTAEDPADYFNRIDKSANIFKVVSARYMKKKSLWMIPQKLPEKKI